MAEGRAFLSGVVEGFYGRPWSEDGRLRLFGQLAGWGLTTYLYAPKDDLKHRALWRVPYTSAELASLRRLVDGANGHGVSFAYAVAPGLDLRYDDDDDLAALTRKVGQLAELGVNTFALLFDDIPRRMRPQDERRFSTFAAAQAHAAHALLEGPLRDRGGTLLVCPTDYCGRMARPSVARSPYLRELGERLSPSIEVFWTGPEVVSETIGVDHVREVARALRRPPVLWDNLHANDYDLRRVYLGPYAGRPSELRRHVRGILSNPNNELEANTVPLATLAAFLRERAYEPRAAFLATVRDWAPAFELAAPDGDARAATVPPEDLAFLADFAYLPFEQGEAAAALLADVAYLQRTPPAAWGDTFARVVATARRLHDLGARLSRLRDRELLHALHPYLADVLLEVGRAADLLARRRLPNRGAPRDGVGNTYGRGIASDLRRLLPPEADPSWRSEPVPAGDGTVDEGGSAGDGAADAGAAIEGAEGA